jgi:hypothetical protein
VVTVIPAGAPGTLGFAISGRLTGAEYEEVLLPPIRSAIERGEPLRVLAVIDDFRGLEPGPLLQELKGVAKLGSGASAPKPHFAVVTDTDWIRRAISLFGRFVPGEVRVFTGAGRGDAETWLAAG